MCRRGGFNKILDSVWWFYKNFRTLLLITTIKKLNLIKLYFYNYIVFYLKLLFNYSWLEIINKNVKI